MVGIISCLKSAFSQPSELSPSVSSKQKIGEGPKGRAPGCTWLFLSMKEGASRRLTTEELFPTNLVLVALFGNILPGNLKVPLESQEVAYNTAKQKRPRRSQALYCRPQCRLQVPALAVTGQKPRHTSPASAH